MTKRTDILNIIKATIINGNYIFTGHAQDRLQQREVTRQEVKQILATGYHEKRKDKFDEIFKEWNYSIRGN